MKITRKKLHKIIKEEISAVLEQSGPGRDGPTIDNAEFQDAIDQHYAGPPFVSVKMGGTGGDIPLNKATVVEILKLARNKIAEMYFPGNAAAKLVPLDAVVDYLQDPEETRDHITNAILPLKKRKEIPPAERKNSAEMIKTTLLDELDLGGTEIGDALEAFPGHTLLDAMDRIKRDALMARQ